MGAKPRPGPHLLHRSSPQPVPIPKGSIATEKDNTRVTPSDSAANGSWTGQERRGSPCHRKALIPIIKTLSCYEQAGGGAGWVGCGRAAAGGHGRDSGGRQAGGEGPKEKKKAFNLAFPHPQPQIHSSCQMQSPLALTLTHCWPPTGGTKGPRGTKRTRPNYTRR